MMTDIRAEVNGTELDITGFPAVIDGLILEKKEHEDGFTLSLQASRDLSFSLNISF